MRHIVVALLLLAAMPLAVSSPAPRTQSFDETGATRVNITAWPADPAFTVNLSAVHAPDVHVDVAAPSVTVEVPVPSVEIHAPPDETVINVPAPNVWVNVTTEGPTSGITFYRTLKWTATCVGTSISKGTYTVPPDQTLAITDVVLTTSPWRDSTLELPHGRLVFPRSSSSETFLSPKTPLEVQGGDSIRVGNTQEAANCGEYGEVTVIGVLR